MAHCSDSLLNALRLGSKNAKIASNDEDAGYPDQVVDQQRDETAADAGDGHLDGDEFRGFDAKLI